MNLQNASCFISPWSGTKNYYKQNKGKYQFKAKSFKIREIREVNKISAKYCNNTGRSFQSILLQVY